MQRPPCRREKQFARRDLSAKPASPPRFLPPRARHTDFQKPWRYKLQDFCRQPWSPCAVSPPGYEFPRETYVRLRVENTPRWSKDSRWLLRLLSAELV